MKKIILAFATIFSLVAVSAGACDKKGKGSCCAKSNEELAGNTAFTCKLTSRELQQRKAEVINVLKSQVLERKELPNGFAYKFASDEQTIDQLVSFIKAEKQCCSFFSFGLEIDEDATWLRLTGAEGVKDFIVAELSF